MSTQTFPPPVYQSICVTYGNKRSIKVYLTLFLERSGICISVCILTQEPGLHISCLFSALVFLWNFLESFFVSSFDPSKNTWNWCIQSTKQITNPNRFGSRFRFQKETSKRLWLHCYHLQKLLYFYKVKAIIYDLIKNHVRGPSQTMLTRFWLSLTTNIPLTFSVV